MLGAQRISKNIFLNTLFCPSLGWDLRHDLVQKDLSLGKRFRMEQGKEVHRLARELYPDGEYLFSRDEMDGTSIASDRWGSPDPGVFFESPFVFGDYITKADILVKNQGAVELIEVKSSVNEKPEQIDDMAYTALIAKESGVAPSTVSLLLLDKNYRQGMDQQFLFKKLDKTKEVFSRMEAFQPQLDYVSEITSLDTKPVPRLSYNCKDCGQFSACLAKDADAHIFDIPRIRQNSIEDLIQREIHSVHDIPDDFRLTPTQREVVDCIKCGEIRIDPSLQQKLDDVTWPAYYLDFETTMTAIPLHAEMAPHDKFPIQYSIHLCDQYGNIVKHVDYLADHQRDCRRDLAEHLVLDLGQHGSIITYSSFEKTTISSLITLFPDLSTALQAIIGRLVDLERCVKCIKHPQFRGRTSIKVVLPVLIPDLSYSNLEISDGDTALAAYAMMAKGWIQGEEIEQTRLSMLEYCKMDTLAMVRLHEELSRLPYQA